MTNTTAAAKKSDAAAKFRTLSAVSQSVADGVIVLVSKSNWFTAVVISVYNKVRSIDLPINVATISNSFYQSCTSYSTYLVSSVSSRTELRGKQGA